MENRWRIEKNSNLLVWDCQKHPEDHVDFLEMSGLYSSAVITYGIQEGKPYLHRHVVFFVFFPIIPTEAFSAICPTSGYR